MASLNRILRDVLATATSDAIEVFGSRLQKKLFAVCIAAAILLAAMIFLTGAAGIAFAGVYLLLAPQLGSAAAAFLCAALALVCGLLMLLWARSTGGFD